MSSTTFEYRDFAASVSGDTTIVATLAVTNTGQRAGADVPQIYLIDDDVVDTKGVTLAARSFGR
jgi:beta-glucosidase